MFYSAVLLHIVAAVMTGQSGAAKQNPGYISYPGSDGKSVTSFARPLGRLEVQTPGFLCFVCCKKN